jgi:hypothetical protein
MKRILGVLAAAAVMLTAASAANAAPFPMSILLSSPSPLSGSGGDTFATSGSFADDISLYLSGAPAFLVNATASSTVNGGSGIPDIKIQLFDPIDVLVASGTLLTALNVHSSTILGGGVLLTSTGPSPATPYRIHVTGTNGPDGGSYQYSVSATASVVPIPAAALLFGSGLAFLGFAARRPILKSRAKV